MDDLETAEAYRREAEFYKEKAEGVYDFFRKKKGRPPVDKL